jgi:hypothetical protein
MDLNSMFELYFVSFTGTDSNTFTLVHSIPVLKRGTQQHFLVFTIGLFFQICCSDEFDIFCTAIHGISNS